MHNFFSLHIYILINIRSRICHSNRINKKVTDSLQNDNVTGFSSPFSFSTRIRKMEYMKTHML